MLRGLRTILEVERAQVQPLRGLRLALGVAIPLVAGIATGHANLGAFGAGGALGVGFGAFLGGYRTQASAMTAAAVAISMSLFAGSVAGPSAATTTALVMLWTFGAGLLGVFGPSAYFVGLQSVLNLLIGSGLPLGDHAAIGSTKAAPRWSSSRFPRRNSWWTAWRPSHPSWTRKRGTLLNCSASMRTS